MTRSLAAWATALVLAAPAHAGTEEPAWIPGLELGFDVWNIGGEGSTTSPEVNGANEKSDEQANFRVGVELLAPPIDFLPGAPRAFGAGGVWLSDRTTFHFIDEGNRAVGDADQEIADYLASLPVPPPQQKDPEDFGGQGHEQGFTFERPGWYATMGLAWSFPVSGSDVIWRVKPSVEYSGRRVEMFGKYTRVTEPSPDDFDVFRANADESDTQHWLGPGFEIEFVFAGKGSITSALFAGFHTVFLLSDDEFVFADPANGATFRTELDDVAYRGRAGLRFSWTGLTPGGE